MSHFYVCLSLSVCHYLPLQENYVVSFQQGHWNSHSPLPANDSLRPAHKNQQNYVNQIAAINVKQLQKYENTMGY